MYLPSCPRKHNGPPSLQVDKWIWNAQPITYHQTDAFSSLTHYMYYQFVLEERFLFSCIVNHHHQSSVPTLNSLNLNCTYIICDRFVYFCIFCTIFVYLRLENNQYG